MKPITINNLEVAKNQEKLEGKIDVNDCLRLKDMLAQQSEEAQGINYQLSGGGSKHHLPSLKLSVDAVLTVVCQRCLSAMQLPLSVEYDYVVSKTEPEAIDGDDDVDWLEASREMNLSELIEDELLIAMPLAPTHGHSCKPAKHESGEKHNPFAVLKGVIK